MPKKKILIALFRLPYPATDGTRFKILYNLIDGLAKEYSLEFFVVNISNYHPDDIAFLEKNYGKVHFFHHSKLAFLFNDIPVLWSGLPHQAQAFHFSDAQRWLDDNINNYDAVYIHEIRMTEYFIRYDNSLKHKFLVDFNDAISMNYRKGIKTMNIFKKIFYAWEGFLVSRYESHILNSFFHYFVVSRLDREYLIRNHSLRYPETQRSLQLLENITNNKFTGVDNKEVDFLVINHGAPIGDQIARCDQSKVFFLGSLDYEPNQDALTFFLDTIWLEVVKNNPSFELLVVGGGSIPARFRSYPNVVYLGFVPEVFQVVERCKALVAPIRFAGGTPSKILEAMGYGIPVITTPNGSAGIFGIRDSENALVIPEANHEQWIQSIERIMTDDSLREKLSRNGRQLILDHYSLPAAQRAFRDRFAEILGDTLKE